MALSIPIKFVRIYKPKIIEDDKIIRQYKLGEDKVKDLEVYGAIMGYREYPIMVDGKLIPTNEN